MSFLVAAPASAQSSTVATLEGRLARYEQAWESRDAERAAAPFTADARYHEMPFDAAKSGSGARVESDGVFVLTFGASGRRSELHEWWHVRTNP